MPMEIFLQLRSKVPIYEQIVTQVKQLIISGALKDGDPIPSMRALAKTLQVSVITVQKAYEDLQRKGLIESLAGRGTFIRVPNMDDVRQEYWLAIQDHVEKISKLAKDSGIDVAEIIDLIKTVCEGNGD
ncbi:MAG: GntR family transcriptional regulator [Firmicutes bacterium]|nr:GntR family transcriptional regulator [Bacillota bacterium]